MPRRKLKEALSGPLLSRNEVPDTENVNSRNIFFELDLAARLMNQGIKVTGFEDVQFDYEGYTFCVQCKRLLSEANIKHNIAKAYDQVQKALSVHKKTRGIIALSIEKLWKIDGLVLDVQSPAEAGMRISHDLDKFRREHSHLWDGFLNINVVGIILSFKCLAFPNQKGLHSFAHRLDFVQFPFVRQFQLADTLLMERLQKKLGATVVTN